MHFILIMRKIYMNKKIIVTGANGQLGSELRELSADSTDRFIFIDVDEVDICDMERLSKFLSRENPDFLINCAAYTAVDKAEKEKDIAEKINKTGTGNLALLSSQLKFRMIHISTDFVFDGKKSTPYDEDDEPNPLSFYGKTKWDSEKEVMKYENNIIIRTSWLYSRFGNNFVKTIQRLASEKDTISVVYDQVGAPTNARDLAACILSIIDESNNFPAGMYHFSNEGVASWYDFACSILEYTNKKTTVLPIRSSEYPSLAVRPSYSILSKNKIKKYLDIKIPDWRQSLKALLQS
jgi:dTDP-4-dehydrorhamnose reductase